MEKSNSDVQFHRLLEAFDKWEVMEEDRDNLLSILYGFGYMILRALYKSQVKRNGGKRNGR